MEQPPPAPGLPPERPAPPKHEPPPVPLSPGPIPEPLRGTWPCERCDTRGWVRRIGVAFPCPVCRGEGGFGGGFPIGPRLPVWLPYSLARRYFGREWNS